MSTLPGAASEAAGVRAQSEARIERRLLAFDALSKLTAQFARSPDPQRLIETCILTLAGQFAVAEAFAALRHPATESDRSLYYATGKFRHHPVLQLLGLSLEGIQALVESGHPQTIDELMDQRVDHELVSTLRTAKVRLVIPLIHEGKLAGLIGLGDKVTGRPYDRSEIELLATVSGTLTPLLMSSFLFAEIAGLKTWYLEILDSVKQGLFVFDAEERLRKVNAAGVKLREALRGAQPLPGPLRLGTMAECFPHSSCPGWMERLREVRHGGGPRAFHSQLTLTSDAERIFSVRVAPIRREAQETGDFIVTLDDITQRKENERRFFELQKLAEQGVMVSSIAHELNNLLGVVGGAAELAELALKRGDHDRLQRSITKVRTGVARMDRFTSGLTDARKLQPAKSMQSLNAVITDVLSYVAGRTRFADIETEVVLAPDLPTLSMDADQMGQLLLNLLNNAADAIRGADHLPGRIQLETRMATDGVQLAIEDNGGGIDPNLRERLFRDRFTTKTSGHGYGLVTCAKIIEGHNGRIEVESEVGKGTRFIITLPVPERAAPAQAE